MEGTRWEDVDEEGCGWVCDCSCFVFWLVLGLWSDSGCRCWEDARMLVAVLEVLGRLEREVRCRSCSVEETERPSGRGGKIPSSEAVSSSSAPVGCPLTGSTDDGYTEVNVNRVNEMWVRNPYACMCLWSWIQVCVCMVGGPGDECGVVRVDVCGLNLD